MKEFNIKFQKYLIKSFLKVKMEENGLRHIRGIIPDAIRPAVEKGVSEGRLPEGTTAEDLFRSTGSNISRNESSDLSNSRGNSR